MRLLRLDIRGFGRLRGSYPLDAGTGRAGLLLERNEAGKSTLVDALLAGLYGLDRDRRRSRDRMVGKDVYRPWEASAFGLVLHVRVGDHEYSIDRDFDRNTVRVVSGSQDVTDRFREGSMVLVGEKLLGLSREQFLRSSFVRQGEIVWGDASGLSEALQRIADSGPGETTSAAAIEALDRALGTYEGEAVKKGRVETEIQRLEERVEKSRVELNALLEKRASYGERIDQLGQSDRRRTERERQRRGLHRASLANDLGELRDKIASDDDARRHLRSLEEVDARDADLLKIDERQVELAERAHMQLVGARRAAQDYGREAEAAESLRRDALEARAALELERTPTGEDLDTLVSARARVREAQSQRERFEEELVAEKREVDRRGFPLAHARALLLAFDALPPEDRELLSSHTRTQLTNQEDIERAEADCAAWKRIRAEIRRTRQSRKHFGIWLMIVGMLPILIGLSMFGILSFSPFFLHGPGGVAVLIGIVIYATGTRYRTREDSSAKERVLALRWEVDELEATGHAYRGRWQDLATRVGLDPDQMEERYHAVRTIERNVDTVRRLEERIVECSRQQTEALSSLEPVWGIFGDAPSVDTLEERIQLLKQAFDRYREADSAVANAAGLRLKADEMRVREGERATEARAALRDCGIVVPDGDDQDEGFSKLKERATAAGRAKYRRDSEIPEARRVVLAEDERARLVKRAGEIVGEIAKLDSAGVTAPQLPPEIPSQRRQRIQALLRELSAQERRESEERESEFTEVRAFLSQYDTSVPPLMEGIDRDERALRRAEQFREAVTLARDTLAEISTETYRDWAQLLNQHAEELLQGLANDAKNIRFDESLGFQIVHSGQLLTGRQASQQLSAGALDGLYLAARLAVSRMLSNGEIGLPVVLDDPFANADDGRLLAGLRLIMNGLAPHQQVIMMACQHSRYQWALSQLGRPDDIILLQLPTESQLESSDSGSGA